MTHQDVDAGDIIDRYMRGTLEPEASAAFEEHFFACPACLAALRDAERLRGAVRDAGDAGTLPQIAAPGAVKPAFPMLAWLPVAATVVLGVGLSWMILQRVPRLQSELAAVTADRDALSAARATASAAAPMPAIEANLPIMLLQSERDASGEPPTIAIPPDASRLIVWMSAPAAATPVRLLVLAPDGREVTHVDGVRRNSEGAYVVSVPTSLVPSQTFRLRLFAGDGFRTLIGEYVVRVTVAR